mmetsp:Transcript_1486/g.3350  ORF Transcript_1486/g.3350 Transcript_1486/m.3350 type:complete len:398 (-) Transcript_1486:88-1281(-)
MDNYGLSRSFTNELQQAQQTLAGIGLLMQQDASEDKVFIKSVVAGGACERDGSVQVGDYVLQVNGENVVGYPVASIRERIVGPVGSTVRVVFESGRTGQQYERSFVRGNAQNQASMPVMTQQQFVPTQTVSQPPILSRSMDARYIPLPTNVSTMSRAAAHPLSASLNITSMQDNEVSRLKSKVIELEAVLNRSNDELGRTKAMLDHDRTASMRSVKEIDSIQRKNSGQVVDIQTQLNKSEQACRELEIQVSNGKAREEEFHLAFTRAKEQTEARETYFSDLKRQFEEMKHHFERDLQLARDAKAEADRGRMVAEADIGRMNNEVKDMKEKERDRREREEGVRQLMQEAENKLAEARRMEEQVRGKAQALHLLMAQWHKDFFVNKTKEEADLENYFMN